MDLSWIHESLFYFKLQNNFEIRVGLSLDISLPTCLLQQKYAHGPVYIVLINSVNNVRTMVNHAFDSLSLGLCLVCVLSVLPRSQTAAVYLAKVTVICFNSVSVTFKRLICLMHCKSSHLSVFDNSYTSFLPRGAT